MIPSASDSTGDHLSVWQAGESWVDHAGTVGSAYHSSITASAGPATAVASSARYLPNHRNQILDWENNMLLATHHSNAASSAAANNAQDAVYDHVASDYNKAAGISPIQADSITSFSHARHYEDLVSAHLASSANSGTFASSNAWGLLNTVCSRAGTTGTLPQEVPFLQQTAAGQFSGYDSLQGTDGLGAFGSLGAAAATGLYADSLRSSGSTACIGLSSLDHRRLDDIMKRELYTAQPDFNTSRLGLNLGGRTYFSADDFAFSRWGKRLRPNSPGGMMQPAPPCQAEGCKADLSLAKHYHRRHKVCEFHSKAATVHIGNQTQRFCQQCSRFHALDEFDDGKRSCRKRLADHNRRRRKPQHTPMSSAANSAGVLAEDAATATNAEQSQRTQENSTAATDLPPCKGSALSQEGTTRESDSGNDVSGALSGKSSPTIAGEDHPKPASGSSKAMSPAATDQREAGIGSKRGANELGDLPRHEQRKGINSSRAPLALSSSCHPMDMAAASPKTSHLSASLSLGGATEVLDVKPAPHVIQASVAGAQDGIPFGSPRGSIKHAAAMPWLQGLRTNHHSRTGRLYEEPRTDSAASEAGEQAHYLGRKGMPSLKLIESNVNRGSWINTTGAPAVTASDSSADAVLLHSRYSDGPKTEDREPGSHELLRLLGDDRELLTANKHGILQSASGSSLETLAFLDHPLDQPCFARSDQQHRLLHYSNLQNTDSETPMSLDHVPSTSTAFDSHLI